MNSSMEKNGKWLFIFLPMPELEEFLGEDSRIVAFQKRFQIDHIDREATWYMGWIFPGYDTVDDQLPKKQCYNEN